MGLSPSDVMGLAFTITADPTQAEQALQGLEKTAERTFKETIPTSAKGTDDSILNARQSVMLLSQEFGIHLPRAVTAAIAEILPSVATMGGAFLAVFAVKEIVAFSAQVKKLADDFNGVTQAAKVLEEIGKENVK